MKHERTNDNSGMSGALARARRYEAEQEAQIPAEARPAFHLSPRVGWMNDPNGLSYYDGQYHLFYQYHPYDCHWGPMHWGHAVSEDLLRWRYLPAALAPDAPYDRGGCFSGSAVALPDGRHLLMYTGVSQAEQGRPLQTQNLAFGDGADYHKYEKNPVLTGADLPEGCSPYDFRDPKLWIAPDGSFRAAVACDRPGPDGANGRILLFGSDDLERWTCLGPAAENDGRLGLMWECPDLFSLDGRAVLLASAQGMRARDPEYPSGNVSFCLLGDFDAETGRFVEASNQAVDYGLDFYAPQTLLTPDGRRVMIGWMQNWEALLDRDPDARWFGQTTLPRELFVKGGRLCQRPIRELEALRGEAAVHRDVAIADGALGLPGIGGRCAELELEIGPDGAPLDRFEVRFAQGGGLYTAIRFLPRESAVEADRRFSGSRHSVVHQRRVRVSCAGGRLRLRLILDRYSAEAFVNDGEQVLSLALHTDPSARGISFLAEGKARFSVTGYPLRG